MKRLLAHPRLPLAIALLALLINLPALGHGLEADDHLLRANLTGDARFAPLRTAPWDAFNFFPTDRGADAAWVIDRGFAPYWAYPEMHARFFRPLSSLTHAAELRAYPGAPWLMHLTSILLYALCCVLAARLFRRFVAPDAGTAWPAGLAALFYVWDQAHGMPAAWISHRNALLAAAFGLAALLAHDRWRRDGSRRHGLLAPLWLALALASGEAALGIGGYLVAYALCFDRGGAGARLRSLLPSAAVAVAWLACYKAGGFGVRGSGVYLDPVAQPGAFLAALPEHAPLLLAAELGGPGPDFWIVLPPAGRVLFMAWALGALALAAAALRPLLARDRAARFFLVGALLAVIPVSATFPAQRLLLVPGIGLVALVARLCGAVLDREPLWPAGRAGRSTRAPAVLFAVIVGGAHLVLSPLLYQVAIRQAGVVDRATAKLGRGLGDDAALAAQRLVIVDVPDALLGMYLSAQRASHGLPVPAAVTWLGVGTRDLTIERVDADTLIAGTPEGIWGDGFSGLSRPADAPMPAGTRVLLDGVTVEVLETTPAGVPTRTRFDFAVPLEHPSLRFVAWDGDTLVPLAAPAVGERLVRPARPHPLLALPI